MKTTIAQYAKQFNALKDRERIILLIALLVLPILLADSLFITPFNADKSSYQFELQQIEQNTQTLEQEIILFEATANKDPDKKSKQIITQLSNDIDKLDETLKTAEINLIKPQEMTQVLEKILLKNQSLTLIHMTNLPITILELNIPKNKIKTETEKTAEKTEINLPQIYQHGLQITLKGNYLNTLEFVLAVEKFPWQIFWDTVSIKIEKYPSSIITITLHTLSLNQAWIGV
jgi:MSHA biogenesis protein MshJ